MSKPRPRAAEPADRPEILALLAVALRPPTSKEDLTKCLEQLQGWASASESGRALADLAGQFARETRPEREYHRLFLGPSRPVAPPFESVYRDGTAFGPATRGFLSELQEAGLEPLEGFRLPPDHVALEIEFLAHLEVRARQARDQGHHEESAMWSEKARNFVDEHLARWLPLFLARLESGAPQSPYTALVRVAMEVVGIRRPDESPRGAYI